jgi:hypothetical protein
LLFIALLSFSINVSFGQYFKLTPEGFINALEEKNDYIFIDVPNTSQSDLFKKTNIYVNTLYNNPDFVSSKVENEQIVVDAIDSKEITVILSMNESNILHLCYKYIFSLKDNTIKFSPHFKVLINPEHYTIDLIGVSLLGSTAGIYNKKGKCFKQKAIDEVEKCVNDFVDQLKIALNKGAANNDW